MIYDIAVGAYTLGMLDKAEIHRSVELLSDTAEITLPAAQYNVALHVESKLHRGDRVVIRLGYKETGLVTEFTGWLQRISTDGGNIKLICEDDLFLFRKNIPNAKYKKITLQALLEKVMSECGLHYGISCSYSWTYAKFIVNNATGYDVLKKVQEECKADIYLAGGKLHIHPPGEKIGIERFYDFSLNIEESDLTYMNAEDKKVMVVVKSLQPDGTVKEIEVGSTGGDKVEIKCPTSDVKSMKALGEIELKRRSYNGYEGSITGWLIPQCMPADSATIHDSDYPKKDGTYFVSAVTTEFSSSGGKRKVQLGFRLS
jgi:phage protein D